MIKANLNCWRYIYFTLIVVFMTGLDFYVPGVKVSKHEGVIYEFSPFTIFTITSLQSDLLGLFFVKIFFLINVNSFIINKTYNYSKNILRFLKGFRIPNRVIIFYSIKIDIH